MNKNKITTIFFLLVFQQFFLAAFAVAAEKIRQAESGYWIVDGFSIGLNIECEISRSNFIPKKHCTQPSISITKSYNHEQDSNHQNNYYYQISSEEIEFGNISFLKKVPDKNGLVTISDSDIRPNKLQSEKLLRALISEKDDIPLKFMTSPGQGFPIKSKVIVLTGFKTHTEKQINRINYWYDEKENDAQRGLLLGLIIILLFLVATFMLIKYLIKKTNQKIDDVKQHIETRRVSRVAEDEAIREVIRKSVSSTKDESFKMLRDQIKKALDSGDTKTAEELLKVMNRIE